jgi:hypothetical protein
MIGIIPAGQSARPPDRRVSGAGRRERDSLSAAVNRVSGAKYVTISRDTMRYLPVCALGGYAGASGSVTARPACHPMTNSAASTTSRVTTGMVHPPVVVCSNSTTSGPVAATR